MQTKGWGANKRRHFLSFSFSGRRALVINWSRSQTYLCIARIFRVSLANCSRSPLWKSVPDLKIPFSKGILSSNRSLIVHCPICSSLPKDLNLQLYFHSIPIFINIFYQLRRILGYWDSESYLFVYHLTYTTMQKSLGTCF